MSYHFYFFFSFSITWVHISRGFLQCRGKEIIFHMKAEVLMQSLLCCYWEFRQSLDQAWLMIKTARTGKSAIARAVCTSNNYFCKQIFGMFLNCMLKSNTLPKTRHWKTMKGIIQGWKEKIWWPNMYIMHTACVFFFILFLRVRPRVRKAMLCCFHSPCMMIQTVFSLWSPPGKGGFLNCTQTVSAIKVVSVKYEIFWLIT